MIKLIPKINKKIWKTLKKLKLNPLETPEDFIKMAKGRKHRYSTICQDEKDRKFIFYTRLHDSIFERERMRNEVKIAQSLMKKNYSFFPKYFGAKIENNFEWIKREYFQENTLESKKEIEKLAKPLSQEEIEEICKVLFKIQKIKISDFPFLKPKELENFFHLPEEIRKRKIINKKEVETIEKLLKENENLLRKENKYFCHGDFQIGNLIFVKRRLKVIDLESVMISNFAYDICFLWSRLWREKIRKKILKKFYSLLPMTKRRKFEILFLLDSLFLGFHNFCASPKEYSKEILKKRKKFYLNVIKKALKGFKELEKI